MYDFGEYMYDFWVKHKEYGLPVLALLLDLRPLATIELLKCNCMMSWLLVPKRTPEFLLLISIVVIC